MIHLIVRKHLLSLSTSYRLFISLLFEPAIVYLCIFSSTTDAFYLFYLYSLLLVIIPSPKKSNNIGSTVITNYLKIIQIVYNRNSIIFNFYVFVSLVSYIAGIDLFNYNIAYGLIIYGCLYLYKVSMYITLYKTKLS